MKTHVQRWGNSLAVRIPKVLAVKLGVSEDTPIEMDLIDGSLVIRVADETTLEQLLAGITDDNLHSEIESSGPVGAEVW